MRLSVLTAVSAIALAVAFTGPTSRAATAQGAAPTISADMGLAAVVNDDVVTAFDVEQRIRLLLVSTGMPYNADTARAARMTALRALVDESLQFQEARKQSVAIDEAQVEASLQQVIQSARMTPEQFVQTLAQAGVSVDSLKRQLRAELVWNQVVMRRYQGRLSVGAEQVQATIDRIKANAGRPENLVSEIMIAVDNPEQEAPAQQLAQQLFDQIRQGARFSALARQYSQAPSAANGGDIGWILPGQLAAELDDTLNTMQVNSISPPVRAPGGWYIIGLREKRQMPPPPPEVSMVELKQVFVPANISTDDATVAQLSSVLADARDEIDGCSAPRFVLDRLPGATFGEVGMLNVKDLPIEYRNAIDGVPVGKAGGPVRSTDGLHLLVVCDRREQTPDSMMRDAVQRNLEDQQMSMLARRYLRDLRRNATIEVR